MGGWLERHVAGVLEALREAASRRRGVVVRRHWRETAGGEGEYREEDGYNKGILEEEWENDAEKYRRIAKVKAQVSRRHCGLYSLVDQMWHLVPSGPLQLTP